MGVVSVWGDKMVVAAVTQCKYKSDREDFTFLRTHP